MKIVQQRLLRGANLYRSSPCIAAVLELDPAARIDPAYLTMLPAELRDCRDPARLAASLTSYLQQQCGHTLSYAHAEAVTGKPEQRRIVAEYLLEHLAQAALKAAVALVDELLRGAAVELAPVLAALRALSTQLALPDAMKTVAAQARAFGYPVLRVSEHASLLTVGWGSRQWRFVDGAAADSRLLANTVLRDPQLTRALLSEALLDYAADAADETVTVRQGVARRASAATAAVCELAAAKIGLSDAQVSVAEGGKHGLMVTAIAGSAAADYDSAMRLAQLGADERQGRIPAIAVTGTNGKTTTTLMIAHVARHAGLRTGHTTTQGVFIDGRRVMPGDCTGYWSHRAVLTSPQVDFAVLETARGGLLKRGLAFDRCSVGVLLNVSDDHLGLEGVNTIEDLARVKSLVVRYAGAAVLNADDRHCVAAQAVLQQGARTIFFSMRADNPVLRAHMAQGGCGAWLEDEGIMLGEGGRRQPVMKVSDIPATVGGLARYNIANSLAAVAALHASGFSAAQITAGLASFVSDAATNPLRTNIFRVGDIRIVLDYAHNSAAYTELGALTRGLGGGKVLAVVSSPGDRRDDDLLRIGASCAAAFDRLFVYESASRGRPHGDAARLIGDGARAAGSAGVEVFDCAADALRRAYRECAPGDIMMFSCGTSIATLIEALRAVDPQAALAIEAQAG